jgi:hypothetical protein
MQIGLETVIISPLSATETRRCFMAKGRRNWEGYYLGIQIEGVVFQIRHLNNVLNHPGNIFISKNLAIAARDLQVKRKKLPPRATEVKTLAESLRIAGMLRIFNKPRNLGITFTRDIPAQSSQ